MPTNHRDETSAEAQPPRDPRRERLRRAVRYFYDLQKLRIASGNRTADPNDYRNVDDGKGGQKKVKKRKSKSEMDEALVSVINAVRSSLSEESAPPEDKTDVPRVLDEEDRLYLTRQALVIQGLEADTLRRIRELLKAIPIAEWLLAQKGVGPTMAGVLISEIDITRCSTVSQLWAYAGLHVDIESGQAKRRKRGEKANWNSFLKTKTVKILGDSFIKCNSPWRSHYDSYKLRKKSQLVPVCALCQGAGKIDSRIEAKELGEDVDQNAPGSKKTCSNCSGTGGPAPWGKSDAHRDVAAKRYMAKMFLLNLWIRWRTLEGLPVTKTYAEAMLDRTHGDHGGANVQKFHPAPRAVPVSHPWA